MKEHTVPAVCNRRILIRSEVRICAKTCKHMLMGREVILNKSEIVTKAFENNIHVGFGSEGEFQRIKTAVIGKTVLCF